MSKHKMTGEAEGPWAMHALSRHCQQIGPEDFETTTLVIDVDDSTTIGELREMYRTRAPHAMRFSRKFSLELSFQSVEDAL
jgi:hypothetical protein